MVNIFTLVRYIIAQKIEQRRQKKTPSQLMTRCLLFVALILKLKSVSTQYPYKGIVNAIQQTENQQLHQQEMDFHFNTHTLKGGICSQRNHCMVLLYTRYKNQSS